MDKVSAISKPTCREVQQLVSEGLDRHLSLIERARLRLHLVVCESCTNFNGQMALLRQAMRRRAKAGPPP